MVPHYGIVMILPNEMGGHTTSAIRVKDGMEWRIGSTADIAWIENASDFSKPVATEVPPIFPAYCRLELPAPNAQAAQAAHDKAVIDLLGAATDSQQPWWLGYLEYGIGIDLVFNDAPRTELFGWQYVLVQAGPEQALTWRSSCAPDVAWKGALPDLIFPADHSWMLFTPWDERWSDIGGSEYLIDSFTRDPQLRSRTQPLACPQPL
jgi:hypothetical protein